MRLGHVESRHAPWRFAEHALVDDQRREQRSRDRRVQPVVGTERDVRPRPKDVLPRLADRQQQSVHGLGRHPVRRAHAVHVRSPLGGRPDLVERRPPARPADVGGEACRGVDERGAVLGRARRTLLQDDDVPRPLCNLSRRVAPCGVIGKREVRERDRLRREPPRVLLRQAPDHRRHVVPERQAVSDEEHADPVRPPGGRSGRGAPPRRERERGQQSGRGDPCRERARSPHGVLSRFRTSAAFALFGSSASDFS